MSAKERKCPQESANASPKKSAKEHKRAEMSAKKSASAQKLQQPGLKQPGLGTPNLKEKHENQRTFAGRVRVKFVQNEGHEKTTEKPRKKRYTGKAGQSPGLARILVLPGQA